MTFGACGHVACEPCAWRHLLDRYGRRGDDDAPPGDDDDGSANDEDGEGEIPKALYRRMRSGRVRGAPRSKYSTSATTTTTT